MTAKTKRTLVTGASGFLGRHLQVSLREAGAEVVTAGRATLRDIAASESWRKLLQETQPDVVFHLMGSTTERDEIALDAAHVEPTRALLSAAWELKIPDLPIFIIGSAAEYGAVPVDRQPISENEVARPKSAYGRSKLRATEAALDFATRGVHAVVIRLFNVFGHDMSGQLMPGPVLAQLRSGAESVRTGMLDSVRDFLHAEVAMGALAQLAHHVPPPGTIVNLCSGQGLHLRAIVQVMIEASGVAAEVIESGSDTAISTGVHSCVGDPALLARLLGGRPRPPTFDDFAALAMTSLRQLSS